MSLGQEAVEAENRFAHAQGSLNNQSLDMNESQQQQHSMTTTTSEDDYEAFLRSLQASDAATAVKETRQDTNHVENAPAPPSTRNARRSIVRFQDSPVKAVEPDRVFASPPPPSLSLVADIPMLPLSPPAIRTLETITPTLQLEEYDTEDSFPSNEEQYTYSEQPDQYQDDFVQDNYYTSNSHGDNSNTYADHEDDYQSEQEQDDRYDYDSEYISTDDITPPSSPVPDDSPASPVRKLLTQSVKSPFVFLSDEQNVPSEMKKLQEQTIRRRRLFNGRLHQLQCRLAASNATIAEESMDLGLATKDTIARSVARPLENAMERFLLLRDSSKERTMAIRTLSRRVTRLECDRAKFVNVTLFDANRDELDTLQDHLENEVVPVAQLETVKAIKVEGGIVRRHVDMVGVSTRRFHEESTNRRSSVEFQRQQVQSAKEQDQQRLKDALERIKDLRIQLARERAERRLADDQLMDKIESKMSRMKRALLAVTSDQ